MTASPSAQKRISQLAADRQVHRAFQWLHLHQMQMRKWQLEMLRIPAPPFQEAARSKWFLEQFQALGLANAHIDSIGNAIGEFPNHSAGTHGPLLLVSAHLDTVFPAGISTDPTEQDSRICAPGACDNAAGLTALLGLAAAMRHAQIGPPVPILFAANVGEEGEGDLRGMRHLFDGSEYASRISAAVALEGGGNSALVTRALASRRYRVTVTGPGGHSWADAGTPNPILVLARSLLSLESMDILRYEPRTTLNVGHISGGTSVNSIPESATALLDLRCCEPGHLEVVEERIREALKAAILDQPSPRRRASTARPALTMAVIGNRPGGALPDDSPLLTTVRAVDRHLNLRTECGLGSTDANIPLSLGIPAIAIGAGGIGAGIHTLQEWHDPANRTPALRRILLTLLDTAQLVASGK